MRVSKKPEERRQEIIDMAEELFLEHGIEKTSIAQIAQRIGVAKGLVYYYFKTKEDVLDSVIASISQKHIIYLTNRFQKYHSFYEHLLLIIDAYYNVYPNQHEEPSDVVSFEPPLINLFHKQFIRDSEHLLNQVISEGKELGYFQYENPNYILLSTLEGVFSLSDIFHLENDLFISLIEQMLALPKGCLVKYRKSIKVSFD